MDQVSGMECDEVLLNVGFKNKDLSPVKQVLPGAPETQVSEVDGVDLKSRARKQLVYIPEPPVVDRQQQKQKVHSPVIQEPEDVANVLPQGVFRPKTNSLKRKARPEDIRQIEEGLQNKVVVEDPVIQEPKQKISETNELIANINVKKGTPKKIFYDDSDYYGLDISRAFSPQNLKNGSFGSVSKFKYANKSYVIKKFKDVKINANEVTVPLSFNSPFIGQVSGFQYDGSSSYILLKDEGVSLYDWHKSQEGQLHLSKEVNVLHLERDVLCGLDLLHTKNIRHCDIKPENICIKQTNQRYLACLIDFGTSQRENEKSINGITPEYLPPSFNKWYSQLIDKTKQVQVQAISKQDEVWSVGLLPAFIRMGCHPMIKQICSVDAYPPGMKVEDRFRVLEAIGQLTDNHMHLFLSNPDHTKLNKVLTEMLQVQADKRCTVRRALDMLNEILGIPKPRPPVAKLMPPPVKRMRSCVSMEEDEQPASPGLVAWQPNATSSHTQNMVHLKGNHPKSHHSVDTNMDANTQICAGYMDVDQQRFRTSTSHAFLPAKQPEQVIEGKIEAMRQRKVETTPSEYVATSSEYDDLVNSFISQDGGKGKVEPVQPKVEAPAQHLTRQDSVVDLRHRKLQPAQTQHQPMREQRGILRPEVNHGGMIVHRQSVGVNQHGTSMRMLQQPPASQTPFTMLSQPAGGQVTTREKLIITSKNGKIHQQRTYNMTGTIFKNDCNHPGISQGYETFRQQSKKVVEMTYVDEDKSGAGQTMMDTDTNLTSSVQLPRENGAAENLPNFDLI